ncbi:AFG2-interacting ribosome maturation factor [Anabrus simplex]|uniref:AFG2-interacting ribosome maturation factor n=1 Tax=Anabrus simplex TaxID=316456 RepID=UPI0035A2E247
MESFYKCLDAYFVFFRTHKVKWKALMDKAGGPLQALSNLDEQLQMILKVKEGDIELLKLPNLMKNLEAKIRLGMEEEFVTIKSIVEECGKLLTELERKKSTVDQNFPKTGWDPTFQRSVMSPSVFELMEWVGDVFRYYQCIYIGMSNTVSCLDLENEKSVALLKKAFEEDPTSSSYIERILAYTQFLGVEEG